jgi:hypothetical protein
VRDDAQAQRLRSAETVEDWERVIRAAARVQVIVPGAVLVGGTAAALHAGHRFSMDDDHVVRDLASGYEAILAALEEAAGWRTERIQYPKQILGRLDGVDTGIRNQRRAAPLETTVWQTAHGPLVLPTLPEMARIKAWLVVDRNATRDYLDFAALAERLRELHGADAIVRAVLPMDDLYPQPTGESVVRQLARQLAEPRPYDLADNNISAYRWIADRWRSWDEVRETSLRIGAQLERARSLALGDHRRRADERGI